MDGDGIVDVVYAGDLKGKMWKFLVADADPANWEVAFSTTNCGAGSTCVPLFTATDASSNAQPILWPPEVTKNPSGPGVMVFFGTGKYLESSDIGDDAVQTMYGILDKNDGTTAGTRASGLDQLSVNASEETIGGITYNLRKVCELDPSAPPPVDPEAPPPCLDRPTTPVGWYLDLPSDGERVTGVPKLVNGTLFFNTFIPSSSPCDAGGTGWLMAIDYLSGFTPEFEVFPAFAGAVAGVQFGAALGGTTLIQSGTSSKGYAVMSLTKGNIATMGTGVPEINFGGGVRGRITWREIIQ
jgi:type IV pilus assembly protein PilY1